MQINAGERHQYSITVLQYYRAKKALRNVYSLVYAADGCICRYMSKRAQACIVLHYRITFNIQQICINGAMLHTDAPERHSIAKPLPRFTALLLYRSILYSCCAAGNITPLYCITGRHYYFCTV